MKKIVSRTELQQKFLIAFFGKQKSENTGKTVEFSVRQNISLKMVEKYGSKNFDYHKKKTKKKNLKKRKKQSYLFMDIKYGYSAGVSV
jgi:hypothetical protein